MLVAPVTVRAATQQALFFGGEGVVVDGLGEREGAVEAGDQPPAAAGHQPSEPAADPNRASGPSCRTAPGSVRRRWRPLRSRRAGSAGSGAGPVRPGRRGEAARRRPRGSPPSRGHPRRASSRGEDPACARPHRFARLTAKTGDCASYPQSRRSPRSPDPLHVHGLGHRRSCCGFGRLNGALSADGPGRSRRVGPSAPLATGRRPSGGRTPGPPCRGDGGRSADRGLQQPTLRALMQRCVERHARARGRGGGTSSPHVGRAAEEVRDHQDSLVVVDLSLRRPAPELHVEHDTPNRFFYAPTATRPTPVSGRAWSRPLRSNNGDGRRRPGRRTSPRWQSLLHRPRPRVRPDVAFPAPRRP